MSSRQWKLSHRRKPTDQWSPIARRQPTGEQSHVGQRRTRESLRCRVMSRPARRPAWDVARSTEASRTSHFARIRRLKRRPHAISTPREDAFRPLRKPDRPRKRNWCWRSHVPRPAHRQLRLPRAPARFPSPAWHLFYTFGVVKGSWGHKPLCGLRETRGAFAVCKAGKNFLCDLRLTSVLSAVKIFPLDLTTARTTANIACD